MTTPPEDWLPIQTPHLTLRDFREGDQDDVHVYATDPDVVRYMDWGPNSLAETHTFIETQLAHQAVAPRLEFGLAMQHRASGRVIGSMALHMRDIENRTMELGYCLHRDFWRQGLTHEAAHALTGAAFAQLGLHRVFATCDVRNTGSWAVMRKLDMRREACLLRDRRIKGEWRDSYLYAILGDEWRAAGDAAPGPANPNISRA